MEIPSPERLKELMGGLEDPRVEGRSLHRLETILVIGLATVLCGGEHFTDMERFGTAKKDFFGRYVDLSQGVPRHDTFQRVFEALNPEELAGLLVRWTGPTTGDVVAMDGKTVRASKRQGESAIHLISAYAKERGLVLGQVAVEDKSNEIVALPGLIRSLDLADCTVTVDAMGCQRQIAREIHEADADYVLALKGNQGTAHEEVAAYLDDALGRGELPVHQEVDKGHGRLETRRYVQSDRLDWFADRGKWENLQSVAMVEAVRETSQGTSRERRYYLSSLPLDLPRLAHAVRGHWSIENNLHWVLDVTFGEDRCQTAHRTAVQNLGVLRRLALNLLKQDPLKDALRGKRLRAGWDNNYLAKLMKFDA